MFSLQEPRWSVTLPAELLLTAPIISRWSFLIWKNEYGRHSLQVLINKWRELWLNHNQLRSQHQSPGYRARALLIPVRSISSSVSEDAANHLPALRRASIIPGPENPVCIQALPLAAMAKNTLTSPASASSVKWKWLQYPHFRELSEE